MLPAPDPQEFDGCRTADLLAQARSGDPGAWDGIYQRYRMRLLLDARAQLRRRRIPGQGTEDIVQSAFLAAWNQIQRFEYRGEGSFRAWLRTLVVNRVLDRLRRFSLENRLHEADAPEGIETLKEDPGDGPLGQVEHIDSVQRLLTGLEGLPELERDIVVMRAFEHKRWAEIAECCERSRTFVEKHYKLAFKRLARCLGAAPARRDRAGKGIRPAPMEPRTRMREALPDDARGDGGAARESEPDPVTALFEAYLEAAENGSPLDAEVLLRSAGPAAERLAARIRAYDMVQRLAEEFGAEEASAPQPFAIGRFQVLRLLGEGGLGRVFLAEDSALGRLVALKVLDPLQGLEAAERGFVLNEARSLARLEHPGIVRIFEIQAGVGGRPDSIAMEYLAGPTLARVIAELRAERDGAAAAEGAADPAGSVNADAPESSDATTTLCTAIAAKLASYSARAACLLRLAEALAYCHDRGVLHRDIKPANVLFDAQAQPRLVDFGLAHLADRGDDARIDVTQRFVGTPAYVAPEQVESGRTGADPRSDVFSFGTLAYEFLTLVSPFARPTRHLTLESVREAIPQRLASLAPAVPPDLQRIVHRCLERDPEERYPSALHLALDLRALHEQRPLPYAGSSGVRVLRLWTRRHRRRLAGAGLVLLVALAAVLSASISAAQARHARLRAGLERIDQRLEELAGLTTNGVTADGPAAHGVQSLRLAGEGLLDLTGIAADLDESTLQRWIFGSNQPLLERSRGLWSGLLARHIAADEQRSQLAGVPFQWVAWKDLVVLDARLGEGVASREYGARGSLELHASLVSLGDPALYAQVRFGQGLALGYPVYRAVEPVAHPVPGSYRVLVWDTQGQLVFEREVVQLSGWEPARSIALAALDPRPRANAKPYARSSFNIEQPQLGPETPAARLELPAFRLSAHVNVRDYRAFATARKLELSPLVAAAADEDLPAYVSWREAADYCDWVGGRLPACLELAAAQIQGLELLPSWPPLHAEWVLDLDPYAGISQALAFRAALYLANPNGAPMAWVTLNGRDADLSTAPTPEQSQRTGLPWIGTAFRVAFSDDTRAAFEAQSGAR